MRGDAEACLDVRPFMESSARERELWAEALEQTSKRWLQGPYSYGEQGRLFTDKGTPLASPVFRFGVEQVPKLRARDNLKKSRRNKAHTQIDLPT